MIKGDDIMKRNVALLTLVLFLLSVVPLASFADETPAEGEAETISEPATEVEKEPEAPADAPDKKTAADENKKPTDDKKPTENKEPDPPVVDPYQLVGGDLTISMEVKTDPLSKTKAPANDTFAAVVTFTDKKGKALPDLYEFYVTSDIKKPDRSKPLRPRGKIRSGDRLILRDGEAFTIRGLPEGTHFTLALENKANYTTKVKDVAGNIQKSPKAASFTAVYKVVSSTQNNRNTSRTHSPYKRVPKTGYPLWAPVLVLGAAGLLRRRF